MLSIRQKFQVFAKNLRQVRREKQQTSVATSLTKIKDNKFLCTTFKSVVVMLIPVYTVYLSLLTVIKQMTEI